MIGQIILLKWNEPHDGWSGEGEKKGDIAICECNILFFSLSITIMIIMIPSDQIFIIFLYLPSPPLIYFFLVIKNETLEGK